MRRSIAFFCITTAIAVAVLTSFGPTFAQSQRPSALYRHVCNTTVRRGFAHCNAIQVMRTDTGILPLASKPSGLTPSNLQSAYNLPSAWAGNGQTIAIVDAQDDPRAETDLNTYRRQFGLPACTTANGCFSKIDENGGTEYPASDVSWGKEISLDLDMVSAICPNCHIILVEGYSSSILDLAVGVDTAVQQGANVVSNSYGGSEDSSELDSAADYDHSGVVITASTGDAGFGVEVPAAFNTVVAVGGTTLTRANNARGWSETAWGGAGSGCSAFISKPSWQQDSGCDNRTITDVSAVADPQTGVAVYDSYGAAGWILEGGTSASAPIIAGVYGLAGNASQINAASSLYSNRASLNDVTSGNNGSCNPSYLCTAGPGYDGPTGLGTPKGIQAF